MSVSALDSPLKYCKFLGFPGKKEREYKRSRVYKSERAKRFPFARHMLLILDDSRVVGCSSRASNNQDVKGGIKQNSSWCFVQTKSTNTNFLTLTDVSKKYLILGHANDDIFRIWRIIDLCEGHKGRLQSFQF